MNKLDNKSEALIQRTLEIINNEREYRAFVGRVMDRTFSFFMDIPRDLMALLYEEKARAGALEHGIPLTEPVDILTEIKNEHLDLMGWGSMLEMALLDQKEQIIK